MMTENSTTVENQLAYN